MFFGGAMIKGSRVELKLEVEGSGGCPQVVVENLYFILSEKEKFLRI